MSAPAEGAEAAAARGACAVRGRAVRGRDQNEEQGQARETSEKSGRQLRQSGLSHPDPAVDE